MSWKEVFVLTLPVIVSYLWITSPIDPIIVKESTPDVPYDGSLSINQDMKNSKKILENIGEGPESIAIDKIGNLYTGFLDGRLIKVEPDRNANIGEGKVTVLASGKIENALATDPNYAHGRPLGVRYCEKLDKLFVADSYYGIYEFDLVTNTRKILVSATRVGIEPNMKLPNDLTLTDDCELIYFTDSSSRFFLHSLVLEKLEGTNNGRVFRYELRKDKLTEISNGFYFSNGIQLVQNESMLIIAETYKSRLLYMNIKTGKITKRIPLPALPDNIRPAKTRGQYWVACPISRSKLEFLLTGYIWLRKLAVSLLPHDVLYTFANKKIGMAIKVDENGNIVSSIHDTTGTHARCISEVHETTEHGLYLGSFLNKFVVKMKPIV